MRISENVRTTRPPLFVWLIAVVVASLRALPFIELQMSSPDEGVYVPIGYLPRDLLAYVAMERQLSDGGAGWFLSNPFVTDPQDGRFILLYHQLLGAVQAVTGLDPFWLLELSRFALLLLFFGVLWRFLTEVLDDERQRLCATTLVAFAGGLEALVLPLARHLFPSMSEFIARDLWHLFGWSSFGSFYNPLWVAGLTLLLLTLQPLLRPKPGGITGNLAAGFFFLVLALTHSYTAILALGILAGLVLMEWLLNPAALRERVTRIITALALPVFLWGMILRWQLGDEVFRQSAGGFWGPRTLSVFWYPVGFGALAFFAVRGWQHWSRAGHPWAIALGGWILGAGLLASSPIMNGFHFLFGLHLPLCIAATPALLAWLDEMRSRGMWGRLQVTCVATLLFVSPVYTTVCSLTEARTESRVSIGYARALVVLERLPPSLILAPPELGNLIPAFAPHRVWVGHWFMTPDFAGRKQWYRDLVEHPKEQAENLIRLIDEQRINVIIVPNQTLDALEPALGPRLESVSRDATFSIVKLRTIGTR